MRRYRNAGYGLFDLMLLPGIFRSRLMVCPKIVSFAHLCTVQDYGLGHLAAFRQFKMNTITMRGHLTEHFIVRPEFTDTLAIKSGRHPIREKIHKDRFIPNDVYASQQSRFVDSPETAVIPRPSQMIFVQ